MNLQSRLVNIQASLQCDPLFNIIIFAIQERDARARAEPWIPPLNLVHQDGGFGGHLVLGVRGQVCEEATKDLPDF